MLRHILCHILPCSNQETFFNISSKFERTCFGRSRRSISLVLVSLTNDRLVIILIIVVINQWVDLFSLREISYSIWTLLFQVIHWNSPLKVHVKSFRREIAYFRDLYLTFLEYDGNLLRRGILGCSKANETIQSKIQHQVSEIIKTFL